MDRLTPLEARIVRAVESYQSSDTRVIAAAVGEHFMVALAVLVDLERRDVVVFETLGRAELWSLAPHRALAA